MSEDKSFAQLLAELNAAPAPPPMPAKPPKDCLSLSVQAAKAKSGRIVCGKPGEEMAGTSQSDFQGNSARISREGSRMAGEYARNAAWETGRKGQRHMEQAASKGE